MRLANFKIK